MARHLRHKNPYLEKTKIALYAANFNPFTQEYHKEDKNKSVSESTLPQKRGINKSYRSEVINAMKTEAEKGNVEA